MYLKGQSWIQSCLTPSLYLTSSLMIWMILQSVLSVSLHQSQNWKEWMDGQRVMLSSRCTSTGWRSGRTRTSWSSTRGNVMSCIGGENTPGPSKWGQPPSWKEIQLDEFQSLTKSHEDNIGPEESLLLEIWDCLTWRKEDSRWVLLMNINSCRECTMKMELGSFWLSLVMGQEATGVNQNV